MSSQAEQRRVRQVIELLANILKQNGFLEIHAEVFRQAKFDKPEAVEPVWNLLFQTVYLIHNGRVDDSCYDLLLELARAKSEMVFSVKKAMLQFGYISSEFLALPDDMSVGSRQLLLAFGWLLCKQEVISRLMFSSTKELFVDGDDDARFLYRESAAASDDAASKGVDFDRLGLYEKVSRLIWLNGKLQYRLRKLLTLERQLVRAKRSVAIASDGDRGRGDSGPPGSAAGARLQDNVQQQFLDYLAVEYDRRHLTLLELQLLKRPGELEKHVAALEEDRERLQNLLRWRAEEDLFWDWLLSALQLDSTARPDENGNASDSSSITTVSHVSGGSSEPLQPLDTFDVQQLAAAHARLERACTQYESLASRIDAEWRKRMATSLGPDADGALRRALDATLRQIDAQIDAELRVLARFGWLLAPDYRSDAQQQLEQTLRGELECSTRYYYVHDAAKNNSKRNAATSSSANASSNATLNSRSFATVSSVQSEIARLEADLAGLDSSLQSRYRTFSGELKSLTGRLALPQDMAGSGLELDLLDKSDASKCKLLFPHLRQSSGERT